MTLALHLTVQSVGRGSSEAVLTADADELVIPQGWGTDSNAITSTTEGPVTGAELRLTFDGHECPLQVGQVITLTGDFTPADADDEDQGGEPEESSAPDDEPRPATARKRAAKKTPAKKTTAKKAASK